MALEVYLNFDGNCYEAVEFYSKVFKTKMQNVMYFADMPENPDFVLTDEIKKLVLHTFLYINDTMVMFSDCPPNIPLKKGNNTALVINKDNTEEIKELFNSLKDGGTVVMELQETFWSKLYAFVEDKYGILWHLIYTEKN
jgi:PhnB protein